MNKLYWFNQFRFFANKKYQEIENSGQDYKTKAKKMNAAIKSFAEEKTAWVKNQAQKEHWEREELLNQTLLLTYCSYVVMLEYRNKFWPYEYMAFSRRIGELWEPFCKIPFVIPVRELKIISPPLFSEFQKRIELNTINYINQLNLPNTVKQELISQYKIPWSLVDSGGIQLNLDLHFKQNGFNYNCDFKSGFSSNEKGNTNRLLLVSSIYQSIGKRERTIIFVRQNEDQNNHYLQTIKNSGLWEVYCGDQTYLKIKEFTGFNLRQWIDKNIKWVDDISPDFHNHLKENDLLKYLVW